jgi:polyisoprenoid-binding protein YceI
MIFKFFTALSILLIHPLLANELTVKMILSPAGSIEARTQKVRGEILKTGDKYAASSLWVKIDDLKTGIDLRDDHFHKHLNFENFPKITFTNVVASAGVGSGTLTVNGISNKVDFTFKSSGEKKVEALMKIKASTFKLKEAKYLEIGVDDEVEVLAVMDVK